MAVILASSSATRQQLLRDAGIDFTCEPPPVDEAQLKATHPGLKPEAMAILLATAKALAVSQQHSGELVIGADQVLAFGDDIYDKPRSREEAGNQLRNLRGHSHVLVSAVCCARAGQAVWQCCEQARLTMREFSDDFLDHYLNRTGSSITSSVGGYKLEGLGLQLFTAIDGDHFTILGLPMLQLLNFLRMAGEIPS